MWKRVAMVFSTNGSFLEYFSEISSFLVCEGSNVIE